MAWNPAQYLAFADHRLRPGYDLLARVPQDLPQAPIVDLGCGTGELTVQLGRRWRARTVVGLDQSPEMLAEARLRRSRVDWVRGDIAAFAPTLTLALVFSNAALHWLPDHAALIPRLFGLLAPGGVLALQVPNNVAAASHVALRAAVAAGPTGLAETLRATPVAPPATWLGWLEEAGARQIDIWETEYLQVLRGPDPVLAWLAGSALVPVLAALDEGARPAFLADLAARLAEAYPPRPDGTVLFPFRRLFIVARR